MTDLPAGWEWSTVGEVGSVGLGRQRAPKWHNGPNMRPYLRVANVFEDRIDLTDVKEMDFSPKDFERFKLEPGDILLNEGQSPEWVGRPAMYRGELPGACFTNSLIRFRPHDGIDGRFALYVFRHHLHSGRFMREARITTNIAHLSSTRFATVEFPVPPLAEQHRIVEAVEEHLSRLYAAEAAARAARNRLTRFADAALESIFDRSWPRVPLDAVNDRDRPICYGILKPKTPGPREVPYVEVRSITGRHIKVDGLHRTTRAMHEAFLRSELQADDVVLAIRGSFDRAAVVPESLAGGNVSRDVARIAPTSVLVPAFLASYLVSPEARQFFRAHARGVAVQGINIGDLRRLTVPLPSIDDQASAVGRADAFAAAAERISTEIRAVEARSRQLRRSILSSACSGRLVAQSAHDEPASRLLGRIRAIHAGAPRKGGQKVKES